MKKYDIDTGYYGDGYIPKEDEYGDWVRAEVGDILYEALVKIATYGKGSSITVTPPSSHVLQNLAKEALEKINEM